MFVRLTLLMPIDEPSRAGDEDRQSDVLDVGESRNGGQQRKASGIGSPAAIATSAWCRNLSMASAEASTPDPV